MNLTTATLQELRERKAEIESILLSGQAENIGSLTDERNMISNKIAELAENEPEAEVIEEDPVITRAMEEIGLFGTPLGAYISNDVIHLSVRKVVLPVVYRLMEELETTKAANEINETNAKDELAELQKQIDERDADIIALKKEVYDLQLIADDRVTKIDNAYNELQEAKQTIDQLNEKLTAANTEKPKLRTNVEGPGEVEVKRKRAVYDVEYFGMNNNRFRAKYADTDESFENYSIYFAALYTEVTAEEAKPFRDEYLAANQPKVDSNSGEQGSPVEEPTVIVEPPFQNDSESAGPELAEEPSSVVGQVSTKDFEALKAEVAAINTYLGRNN